MLLLKLPPCPSNKVHALIVQREGPLNDAGSLYFPGCILFPGKPYSRPTQLGACLWRSVTSSYVLTPFNFGLGVTWLISSAALYSSTSVWCPCTVVVKHNSCKFGILCLGCHFGCRRSLLCATFLTILTCFLSYSSVLMGYQWVFLW
jgi:hypothetical protein